MMLLSYLPENHSLFNLDLRDNLGVKQKVFRQLALKLLASYTAVGKKSPAEVWSRDSMYFNSDLLVVKIPNGMVKLYARRLETIRV